MPFFRAIVEVKGLKIPDTEGNKPISGYYCTVSFHAEADTIDLREAGALGAAESLFERSKLERYRDGAGKISAWVDSSWRISFFGYVWYHFVKRDRGFTFFTGDD